MEKQSDPKLRDSGGAKELAAFAAVVNRQENGG